MITTKQRAHFKSLTHKDYTMSTRFERYHAMLCYNNHKMFFPLFFLILEGVLSCYTNMWFAHIALDLGVLTLQESKESKSYPEPLDCVATQRSHQQYIFYSMKIFTAYIFCEMEHCSWLHRGLSSMIFNDFIVVIYKYRHKINISNRQDWSA